MLQKCQEHNDYPSPELPDVQKITESLDNILNNDDKLEAALDMFCYIARLQAFNDGNKNAIQK